jgi:hypothetical protein
MLQGAKLKEISAKASGKDKRQFGQARRRKAPAAQGDGED